MCHETFDELDSTFQLEYLDSRILAIDIDQLTRILWLCGKPDDEFLSKISSEEVSRKALYYSISFCFHFHALSGTQMDLRLTVFLFCCMNALYFAFLKM